MLEAVILIVYVFLIAPILYSFGFVNPYLYILLLLIFTAPGFYAMLKGAPFVPTHKSKAEKMLNLAKITKDSIVFDLGSGDGRFVFGSIQKGAQKATGYEISIPIYLYSKVKSLFIPKSSIQFKNFWSHPKDLASADIIFCFLMIKSMQNFEAKIWPHLKPGAKVISNTFKLPNIQPIYDQDGIRIYQK